MLLKQSQSAFDRIVANATQSIAATPNHDRPLISFNDLKIRTKDAELKPFVPNSAQRRYLPQIWPGWEDPLSKLPDGLRELILKARQEGISTLIAALFFCDTLNTPYTQTVVIAHRSDSTEKLFQMVQLFHKFLPEHKKLPTKYASKREFYWPDIESSYYVGTAGERDFGRATTVNNVHGSEVAFWPDAKKLMSGLLQAVPKKGRVFLESTANGVGDYYNTEYDEAQNGNSVFYPRFLPWFALDEYRHDVPAGFVPTQEEEKLAKLYQLSFEQLEWRRYKIKEIRDEFRQEYPATPEEAFIVTGNSYFNLEHLQILQQEVKTTLTVKSPSGPLRTLATRELQVYVAPRKGRRYILAADPSEGINEYGNHDYCSADVLDEETLEQAAHLHGRWDTYDFGVLLNALGWWYGSDSRPALLAVERNNHGHAVINTLLNICNYPKMAVGLPGGLWLHKEFDQRKKMRIRRPGWPTNKATKFFALDELATAIEEMTTKINSPDTIRELMKFVKLPGGKAEGAQGSHDDRVSSISIGYGVKRLRPLPRAKPQPWSGQYGEYI